VTGGLLLLGDDTRAGTAVEATELVAGDRILDL
jgi:hypothetical protein